MNTFNYFKNYILLSLFSIASLSTLCSSMSNIFLFYLFYTKKKKLVDCQVCFHCLNSSVSLWSFSIELHSFPQNSICHSGFSTSCFLFQVKAWAFLHLSCLQVSSRLCFLLLLFRGVYLEAASSGSCLFTGTPGSQLWRFSLCFKRPQAVVELSSGPLFLLSPQCSCLAVLS